MSAEAEQSVITASIRAGEGAERARIRKMALDRCEKLEKAGELLPAATLRDFAARLEDR